MLGIKGFILIISILLICFLIYSYYQRVEGYSNYPLTQQRIDYQNKSKRRYNPYADIVDIERVPFIPNGEPGDKTLADLLGTPSVEGDKNAGTLMGLTFSNEMPYSTPPEVGGVLARILKCEAVDKWDCEAFEDPTFAQFCGICTKGGEDHLGRPHIGGLYIDPGLKDHSKSVGQKDDVPSAGKCKGEFITKRPYCDVQKDRFECSQAHSLDDLAVQQKCSLCAFSPINTFIYTGSRGDKSTQYALTGNPLKFSTRLRLAMSETLGATITMTRTSDQVNFVGSYIPNTNVYIFDIPDAMENQEYSILVKYAEYEPYNFTNDDKNTIKKLKTPSYAPLTKAMYGPIMDSFIQDDALAVDVSPLLKRYKIISDCSKPTTYVTDILFRTALGPGDTTANFFPAANVSPPSAQDGPLAVDGRGIDPAPGMPKQLRLEFSDGKSTAYAYGVSGANAAGQTNKTDPVNTDAWTPLCNTPPLSNTDAERMVCEIDSNGVRISNRYYTGGNNDSYYGITGNKVTCAKDIEKHPHGIAGIWESKGSGQRQVPIDISVTRINGIDVGENGVTKLGTLKGSSIIKNIKASATQGIPQNLFWFWDKDPTLTSCDIKVVVPATLRDPTHPEDLKLCPVGPLISSKQSAKLMNSGVCEKMVDGKPQGPGTYTDECIQNLFLSSGCTREGKLYPNNTKKIQTFSSDPDSGNIYTADDILERMNSLYTVATTNKDVNGNIADSVTFAKASMDCFGIAITNPCDSAFKNTGPHTADCLDYLFRDAGKSEPSVGSTYFGVVNRSSGTGGKTPIMYCQRAGSLAPIDTNGKINNEAVAKANSFGSVSAVKEFYKKVHYDANYSRDPTTQQLALERCYGVGTKETAPICKGTKARYVRIRPSMKSDNNNIQISQVEVFNVFGKNISKNKKTTSSASTAQPSSVTVDGQTQPRSYPNLFISKADNTQNKSVEYWQIDLGATEEIAYVVYTNMMGPANVISRSDGMRVQLVDDGLAVVKQELLKGLIKETLLFSNMKPGSIIRLNSSIIFNPSKYLGSAITSMPGGETLVQPMSKSAASVRTFNVVEANTQKTNAFSFKLEGTSKFLREQGSRLRISEDDGSVAFKNETSFVAGLSISGNPGEVSFESIVSPNKYLSVSENMGIYINEASTPNQKQFSSWFITVS